MSYELEEVFDILEKLKSLSQYDDEFKHDRIFIQSFQDFLEEIGDLKILKEKYVFEKECMKSGLGIIDLEF